MIPGGLIHTALGSSKPTFNLTVSASTQNYNLKSAAQAAGWDGVTPADITVTINSGVYVGSSSTGGLAFTTGSGIPSGSTLKLINNGNIVGAGGTGAATVFVNNQPGATGGAGGDAIQALYPLTINNNGVIGGGGGGGGSGGNATSSAVGNVFGGGGGGGQGYNGGAGGGNSGSSAGVGVAGTASSSGAGGAGQFKSGSYFGNTSTARGGIGGHGGGLGSAGTAGGPGHGFNIPPGGYTTAGGVGGAAGKCTSTGSNANITWSTAGTRYGSLG